MILLGTSVLACDNEKTSSSATKPAGEGTNVVSGPAAPAEATPSGAQTAADKPGATPSPSTEVPASNTSAWSVAANSALKGRMGRLVVTFPVGAKVSETHCAVFKAGDKKSIEAAYGKLEQELLPGSYDVVISGKRVAGAPVVAKSDTVIQVGVLRVSAGSNTHVEILDADNKTQLTSFYGTRDVGLPVGSFNVMVSGQSAPVEIKAGQVTEF
jgi:hypothetical protein